MSMRNANPLFRYILYILVAVSVLIIIVSCHHKSSNSSNNSVQLFENKAKSNASTDSAAESLDTLTAELSTTKQEVQKITETNEVLQKQNEVLFKKTQGVQDAATAVLSQTVDQLKDKINRLQMSNAPIDSINHSTGPISTIPDLTQTDKKAKFDWLNNKDGLNSIAPQAPKNELKIVPYYTIPANATGVHDRLMTALVGRIPIKGVVTDPYPFKLVFSDDTLAASGLRVPHLQQMIVSGYTEGDLNLSSVRGWITSLTFIFDDGTISTTTSNNNDIGHFTKENALGYLSDARGNPFIRGKLISNAPTYLGGDILLGAAQGAASAYAQAQTTNDTSIFGGNSSTVTGSPGKFVLGQSGMNAANEAQQWWHDREENSFDAVYVPTVDEKGNSVEIAVNFTKEIQIDYDKNGRKIDYEKTNNSDVSRNLD